MKPISFFFFILSFFIFLLSCKRTTEPLINNAGPDTTSHNFTWQTFEFGGVNGSSYFNDVAIIYDNDIWAVGEIYTADTYTYDSLGNFIQPYNAAHWDGQKWELVHINGNGSPINIILAFGKNDIWFQGLLHWDGQTFTLHKENFPLLPNGDGWCMHGTWGTSGSNFYVVGDHGMIAHYDGSSWTKIESGLDYNINDIWGAINQKTGKEEILCVASNTYTVSEKKILKINPITNKVTHIEWPYQDRRIHSLWFLNPAKPWICGAGVFTKKDNDWQEFTELPLIFTYRIRGQENNDVFVAGDFGLLAHYNGSTWRRFTNIQIPLLYTALDYKYNISIVTGINAQDQKAYLIKLTKNPEGGD